MSARLDTEALHQDALVIDSHNDTIVSHIRRNLMGLYGSPVRDKGRRHGTVAEMRGMFDAAARAAEIQIDFPLMREGGIDAAFFAVDVTLAWKSYLPYALDAIGYLLAELADGAGDVVIARTADDIREAKAAGRLAAILVVENSDVLERSLNVLHILHKVGVRSMGLTHNIRSWVADGNAEARSRGGLTEFGAMVVQEMNRLGMLVDVSHIGEAGFWDVMELATRPVIASHSCCKALCDHPRNLTDEQLRAIAENGGSAGVTFVPQFIHADEPTFERLMDHIDHAVQVAGPRHVGIGSDFDGGGTLVKDATEFSRITETLADRGYDEEAVRGILGENHLRVLAEALTPE
jgi:membrane dipeptidase